MATYRSHINKALHNEKLIASGMLDEDFPDWYITVHFYAAVHWIRAYLALNGQPTDSKKEIYYNEFEEYLNEVAKKGKAANPNLPSEIAKMLEEFKDIKSLAHNSRYKCLSNHTYSQTLHGAELALKNIRFFVTTHGIIP